MPVLPLAVGEHDEQGHFGDDLLAMRDLWPDLEPGAPACAAAQVQSLVGGPPSAFSHARLASVTDLNGVRIQLAELTPESLQRKAVDGWK